jgi:FMN phosphatase YigB (HAD superfamily)
MGCRKAVARLLCKNCRRLRCAANEVAYVGDRLDNDVLPAKQAGLLSVFIVRGPWGHIHARQPEAAQADLTIHALDELPAALRRIA